MVRLKKKKKRSTWYKLQQAAQMGLWGKNSQPAVPLPRPPQFSLQQALLPGSWGTLQGSPCLHLGRCKGPWSRDAPCFLILCENWALPALATPAELHPGRGRHDGPAPLGWAGSGCHRQSCQSLPESLVTGVPPLQDEFLQLEFLGLRKLSGVTGLIRHLVFCLSRNCLRRRP